MVAKYKFPLMSGFGAQRYTRLGLVLLITLIAVFALSACGSIREISVLPQEAQPTPVGEEEATPPGSSAGSLEQQAAEIEWYIPSEFILANWYVGYDADIPNRVTLAPALDAQDAHKVAFLLTGASSYFDHAISLTLNTFLGKNVPVEASVFLIEDDDQGKVILDGLEDEEFDLAFTIGSTTAAFVHDNFQGGQVPVVTMLAKDPVLLEQMPDYDSSSGTNIAYTSVSLPVDLQKTYFERLVPRLENIVVLYEGNNASTVKAQVEPLEASTLGTATRVVHVAIEDEEQAVAELQAKLPEALEQTKQNDPQAEKTIVLVTSSRSIFEGFDTVNELSAGYPVVSLSTDLVREGDSSALLSIGVSFDSNTILAALYGLRILEEGVDPGALPVGVIQPPDVAINFAKVREIGMQVPFNFFESATILYGPDGALIRNVGQ